MTQVLTTCPTSHTTKEWQEDGHYNALFAPTGAWVTVPHKTPFCPDCGTPLGADTIEATTQVAHLLTAKDKEITRLGTAYTAAVAAIEKELGDTRAQRGFSANDRELGVAMGLEHALRCVERTFIS
jgi:hypothetical protein